MVNRLAIWKKPDKHSLVKCLILQFIPYEINYPCYAIIELLEFDKGIIKEVPINELEMYYD